MTRVLHLIYAALAAMMVLTSACFALGDSGAIVRADVADAARHDAHEEPIGTAGDATDDAACDDADGLDAELSLLSCAPCVAGAGSERELASPEGRAPPAVDSDLSTPPPRA